MWSIGRKVILGVIFSFAVVFIAFMVFQAKVQEKFFDLKENEIKAIFNENLSRIENETQLIERRARELAEVGAAFYRMKREANGVLEKSVPSGESNVEKKTGKDEETARLSIAVNYKDLIKNFLLKSLKNNKQTLGGGLWFEPFAFGAEDKYFGPYTYWDSDKAVFTMEYSNQEYDYHSQAWYTEALPKNWDRKRPREKNLFWTPPYKDDVQNTVMTTVDALMMNGNGEIIGVATADWSMSKLIADLKKIKMTENSQSFIVHDSTGTIVSYTLDEKKIMAKSGSVSWMKGLSSGKTNETNHLADVSIGDRTYHIYYDSTATGFSYGVMIPTDEFMPELEKAIFIYRTGISILFLLLCGIIFLFLRKVTSPIGSMAEMMKDIAEGEGDLTQRMDIQTNDEVGLLAESFNEFVDKIEKVIISIKGAAETVKTGSREVSSGNNQLSSATQEMASSIEETAASVEEITSSIRDSADESVRISEEMVRTSEAAEKGSGMLRKMKGAMDDLKVSGEKINEIVTVVNDIAFQTNLLALNAAVEAARAGEEGKGFAVVAGEVRTLAGRSAEAAREIRNLVENNEEQIKHAGDLSGEAIETLLKVVERISRSTGSIKDMEQRSKEQASGVEQINSAVSQMDEVTQRNAALVEELASSAEDMSSIADRLTGEVSRFRVGEGSGFVERKVAQRNFDIPAKKEIAAPKATETTPPFSSASTTSEEAFFDDDQFEEF